MKKIIPYSIVCIAMGFLMSSCQSRLSIAKRRYTKGYYVDFGKNNKNLAAIKNREYAYPAKPSNSQTPENSVKDMPFAGISTANSTKVSTASNISIDKKSGSKISLVAKPVVGAEKESNNLMNENSYVQIKNIGNKVDNIKDDEPERAALSLLWIVIVIVLILWLVGLLAGGFGIGGFINLLLVIALILLILWLLRIA